MGEGRTIAVFVRNICIFRCVVGDMVCDHGESLLASSGMFRPTLLAVASILSSAVRSMRGL